MSVKKLVTQRQGGENGRVQQFLVTYSDEFKQETTVAIRLKESFEDAGSGCEPIEFDIDFAGLTKSDMDATVNWKAEGIDNGKTFFTDSNGLGIVKRQYKDVVDEI
jgi:hypothetical protein